MWWLVPTAAACLHVIPGAEVVTIEVHCTAANATATAAAAAALPGVPAVAITAVGAPRAWVNLSAALPCVDGAPVAVVTTGVTFVPYGSGPTGCVAATHRKWTAPPPPRATHGTTTERGIVAAAAVGVAAAAAAFTYRRVLRHAARRQLTARPPPKRSVLPLYAVAVAVRAAAPGSRPAL